MRSDKNVKEIAHEIVAEGGFPLAGDPDHFRDVMWALVTPGSGSFLEDAYDDALWTYADRIRSKLLDVLEDALFTKVEW